MEIQTRNGRSVFVCTYEERLIAKYAGFKWDPVCREWYTTNPEVARRGKEMIESGDLSLSPKLYNEGQEWVYRSLPDDRHVAKTAGMVFDKATSTWRTTSAVVALNVVRSLQQYYERIGDKTHAIYYRTLLSELQTSRNKAVALSSAASTTVEIPCPEGLSYLPYQKAGIVFALEHPRCMIGDEMGLGKTIQAIGVMNADPSVKTVLIVAPLAVTLNWQREIERWSIKERRIGRASATEWPDADVVIIHPQILTRHTDRLAERTWDLVVIDESHLFKSGKAQRTKALLGKVVSRRALALTGTPIPNRPVELWPIIHWLVPNEFRSRSQYSIRYCAGHQSRFGWDESGVSHLDELRERLRTTILMRRLKRDVLTELPAKRRQIIALDNNVTTTVYQAFVAEQEVSGIYEKQLAEAKASVALAKASSDPEVYKQAVAQLRSVQGIAFSQMSDARHKLAVAKAPLVAEHVANALDGGVRKVVVWAHHHDVVNELNAMLSKYGTVVITGETKSEDRQIAMDAFQNGSARVFIGSITAAGIGITLTAASLVVFAELDWVPANITQAEDRCHRIGQNDSVLIQHLVVDGSLDARMARVLVSKQAIADRALDKGQRFEDSEQIILMEEIQTPISRSNWSSSTTKAGSF